MTDTHTDLDHPRYSIGDIADKTGLSADTLRYYEKIGLLVDVPRNAGRRRLYRERDLSRLRFITRAQKMNFTLAEIGALLQMREDPQHAREDIRRMTRNKLQQVESHMEELGKLRTELTLLLNLCRGAEDGCPIIEGLEEPVTAPGNRRDRPRTGR